eukprot:UN10291
MLGVFFSSHFLLKRFQLLSKQITTIWLCQEKPAKSVVICIWGVKQI